MWPRTACSPRQRPGWRSGLDRILRRPPGRQPPAKNLASDPPPLPYTARCAGVPSAEGGGDLQRLAPGQVAFDPDDRPAVVQDQGVGGEPQGLAADAAVGDCEEEVVRVAVDPVSLMAGHRQLFEGRARPEHLAEE